MSHPKQPAHLWGPPMWRTIHSVAYASPSADRFRAFLRGLAGVVPCAKCASEFSRILDGGDPGSGLAPVDALRDADDLLEWTVRVHAKVSPSPTTTWTREMAEASLLTDGLPAGPAGRPAGQAASPPMIGPNALAMGLALGFLIAAVAIGALYAIFLSVASAVRAATRYFL